MNGRERLVNSYLAERLRRIRRERRISLPDLAERISLPYPTCYAKEIGLTPIGLDYLLRFQLATGLPIHDIWFPVSEHVAYVDTDVIRCLLQGISEQSRDVTEEDVVEITASVFQVPVHAVKGGFHHRQIIQARAAAALVVQSHPLLKLADLARLVRRTPRALLKARHCAAKYGPGFWRKVEAVQREVDSL